MTTEKKSERAPVLDPVDRASEVVFGVLMAMSITGSLSVASASRGEVADMLVAALSCNLAWGLTDAVMYLVGESTERHRRASLVRRLREATDTQQAQRLIAEALPERLSDATNPHVLDALRKRLEAVPVPSTRIGADQLAGAVGVFFLVALATFPIVLPFMFIDHPAVALRVSNLLGLATLYGSGHVLGRYAGASAWKFGLAMCAVGAALLAIIIALGG
jgi:VIT1/CCC1 family predicted Fe2+/Mn2+ transporter